MAYSLRQITVNDDILPIKPKAARYPCWQRLLGINILNLYLLLEHIGDYETMHWLEDIHVNDYVIEVSSLPCPHRDRERIGRVLSISQNSVIIEIENGQRIKWENGKLLKIPEFLLD